MDKTEKTLVVILGKSGAGKDTACQYLKTLYGVPRLHPMQQMKAVWEKSAGLKPGSMHTMEGKSTVVGYSENASVSLGDLEIQMYHWLKNRHPEFAANLLYSDLNATFSKPSHRVVSVRGIRNTAEAEVILRAQVAGLFQHLLVIKLESPDCRQVSTDEKLESIIRMLGKKASLVATFHNVREKGFNPLIYFLKDMMHLVQTGKLG